MAKTQAVATTTRGGVAVAEQMPDFMKGKAGAGTEALTNDDIGLPRVALLQGLSPQVEQGLGKPGEFYHLLADRNLGRELAFISILMTPAFILWNPRDNGGGILARADDAVHWSPDNAVFEVKVNGHNIKWATKPTVAESGLGKWGSFDPEDPKSPPAANKLLNDLIFMPTFADISPSIYSFQRSSMKVGKKFGGRLKMSEGPSYGQMFTLTSAKESGPKGDYFVPVITGNGFVADEGVYKRCEELYNHFREIGIKVRDADLEAAANEPGGEEADNGKDTSKDAKGKRRF